MSLCESEFYRSTPAGVALIQALNSMLNDGSITPEIAIKILEIFDSEFPIAVTEQILAHDIPHVEIKGRLDNFNNFNNLWRIDAVNTEMCFNKKKKLRKDRVRILFG